jgi:anti-sigma B factor antagonist
MSLEIKVEDFPNHCKLSLSGKCTVYTAAQLKKTLLEVFSKNENILINLENVTDFDTAGLQVFVSAKNTAKANHKKIKFISHPECVIAIFDLYGLISFFGDKIVLTPNEKKQFLFRYGIKKLPSFMY